MLNEKTKIDKNALERRLVNSRPGLLFRTDSSGMLLGINEPGQPKNDQAPIVYICLDGGSLVIRHKSGLPPAWLLHLKREMEAAAVGGKYIVARMEKILHVAAMALGTKVAIEHGPAFYIPQMEDRVTEVIEVTASNRDCLEPVFAYTAAHLESIQPCMAIIVDGKAVAICRTVRRTSLAVECGVHTLEPYRKRGFAFECVHSWAKKVQTEGLIPCYSTHEENKASLALAKKMEMIRYATDITCIGL